MSCETIQADEREIERAERGETEYGCLERSLIAKGSLMCYRKIKGGVFGISKSCQKSQKRKGP